MVRPRYNIVSDSDYCVNLFAPRSIKPISHQRIIARIHALLAKVKTTNDVSIWWTPAYTNAYSPLAYGNAAAVLCVAAG